MEFIDTHSHNTDEAYAGCEEEVLERACQAGVIKILQADTSEEDRKRTFPFCAKHPGVLYPMLGLYPEYARENWREEVDKLEKWLPERRTVPLNTAHRGMDLQSGRGPQSGSAFPAPVAIGEIGLDYHSEGYLKDCQAAALIAQFEIAAAYDLPVNIHLRDATEDFFLILEKVSGLHLRGNLHAFGGSAQTFRRLQKYGDFLVGIGGVVTFKNAGIAREVADIPLDRIVLETDSPYLAPTPLRGTRNESANIPLIARKIAEIKGVSVEEVAAVTTKNARDLFRI